MESSQGVRFANGSDTARTLDEKDALSGYRSEFIQPPDTIYLVANSLGLLSHRAEDALQTTVASWRELGIRGWTEGELQWVTMAKQVGAAIAPLIGASPEEVVLTGTTTVNLHQCLATLYDPGSDRKGIVTDELAFPSDRYALHSHLKTHGLDPEVHLSFVQPRDQYTLSEDDIIAAMTDEIQLVLLPSVVHLTGQLLDIDLIARAARQRGILLGIDCSHSIGVLPHRFHDDGVDFAIWSTYKFLNGGPGSVAGLFLHETHFGKAPGMAGWFSAAEHDLFSYSPTLTPAPDARAMQIATPCVASLAPLVGSLETIQKAGIDALREKSLRQIQFLMDLIDSGLREFGFEVATPSPPEQRGGHVALIHSNASRISKALQQAGVAADFRRPDIIRVAPSPLYTTFIDCYEAMSRLRAIMREKTYESFPEKPGVVP